MDHALFSSLAHADHPIAAPVSEASLDRLLRRAKLQSDARILDLGCGEARWPLRALELYPRARADGVDTSTHALAGAEAYAAARGLRDRITLREGDTNAFPASGAYDLVLCVGATHAFGGLKETLAAVRSHVRPGGLALVGDGFWERTPDQATLEALGAEPDELLDLPGTVDLVEVAEWTPVYGHVSDPGEWDDYEWSWTGSLGRWAAEHADDPAADDARALAREHRTEWLRGYRGVLGFVCLLLRPRG